MRCITDGGLVGLLCSLPLLRSRVLALKEILDAGLTGDVANEKLACSRANDRVLPQGLQKYVKDVRKSRLKVVKRTI